MRLCVDGPVVEGGGEWISGVSLRAAASCFSPRRPHRERGGAPGEGPKQKRREHPHTPPHDAAPVDFCGLKLEQPSDQRVGDV